MHFQKVYGLYRLLSNYKKFLNLSPEMHLKVAQRIKKQSVIIRQRKKN